MDGPELWIVEVAICIPIPKVGQVDHGIMPGQGMMRAGAYDFVAILTHLGRVFVAACSYT